jgi:hypothetical protein
MAHQPFRKTVTSQPDCGATTRMRAVEPFSVAPRPRTLIHPGPFNPVRINSLHATAARHLRVALPPAYSLFEALVQTLANEGVESASVTILGGSFMQLHYCVAPPDPSGRAVIAYTNPIDAGAAFMFRKCYPWQSRQRCTSGALSCRNPYIHWQRQGGATF